MRTLHTLLAVVFFASPSLAADSWPEHRGPHGNGHADAKGLPAEFSETQNVVWKTAIHDKGWSSPVVWGDQIWMTTSREERKPKQPTDRVEMFAVCVDRKSGKIVHDLKLYDFTKPDFCHDFNSYASPTPVIEDGRVYIHFGTYGTCCLDSATGKPLWERGKISAEKRQWERSKSDFPCDHFRGPGASPILVGNHLILTFDGYDVQYVVALDKNSGKTVWKKDREIAKPVPNGDNRKAYATCSLFEINGKPQLVCPCAYTTVSYDPQTGDELWRFNHGGMNASARPLFAFNKVFLTSGDGGLQLVAVRPDGKGDVTSTNLDWKYNKGVPSRSSLLLIDDLLYMISNNGIATCLEAKTGTMVWTKRLGGNFCASPIFADGKIYIASQEGPIHVLQPGKEGKVLATNKLEEGCMASPAAVGKSLIVRTKTHLYCIEQK
jgi:outer membrane protein assembly factor BamB